MSVCVRQTMKTMWVDNDIGQPSSSYKLESENWKMVVDNFVAGRHDIPIPSWFLLAPRLFINSSTVF